MDYNSFEPNLKFVLQLQEDLRTKYFEQHEKAKHMLEHFSYSLQDVFHKHQKLLAEKVELTIINEKLKQIIDKCKPSHEKISTFNDNQSLQILSHNANNNLAITNQIDSNKRIESKINYKNLIIEKENINEFIPIFSSDFNSDDENKDFEKHNSPPCIVGTATNIQNSPVLSKRKRLSMKKNNLLVSNCINSSSVDKNNSSSNSSTLEKNTEIQHESCKTTKPENNNEPLETIEDTFHSINNNQSNNDCNNILSISKTHFDRTEFLANGKRLRQPKLILKRKRPIIDVSKVDCNKILYNEDVAVREEKNLKNIMYDILDIKKESLKLKQNSITHYTKKTVDNVNKVLTDNELIELSPKQNEKSKLRNKLNLNKKLANSKIVVNALNALNDDKIINFDNGTKCNSTSKNNFEFIENTSKSACLKKNSVKNNFIETKKIKEFKHPIKINAETDFSLDELSHEKNDINNFNTNSNKSEEDMQFETTPMKKLLLDSFDEIPDREKNSPEYAYKEAPVRNKNEKAQLPGWCCRDCEKWYNHLPEEEKTKRKNECSKHRGKYKADILTPESFWNPVFDDTINSSF